MKINKFFNLCLILVSITFFGCSKEEDKSYQVGSLLALTGQHKSFGINQKRGMDIALEEINSDGGINGKPLKIIYADTALDENKALQEYKRLVLEQNLKAIVGVTGSGVALKLAPLAEKDKVLLLSSLDTSPRLTLDGGEYFYRNIASDAYNGEVLVKFANVRKAKNAVLIFNSENSWALGCKQAIIDAVISDGNQKFIQDPIAVLDSTDNFSSAILTLKQHKELESIYVCLMGRQAGMFVKQSVKNGLDANFYGTDSFSQQEFIDNAGDASANAFFVMPASSKSDKYSEFEKKYLKLYGEQADSIAAKAYDAVKIMSSAIKKTKNTDGKYLKKEFESISLDGITGENSFDENGDLKHAEFDKYTYSNLNMLKINK
jgi:branched-chain amino acid transport system substrate-binding protein